jgi:hypothetical protein
VAVVLLVTLAGLIVLLWGYRLLVTEGGKVETGIENRESPFWDASRGME